MNQVERVGVSLDKVLLAKFDALLETQGYPNRSEAFRDLIRDRLAQDQLSNPDVDAVAMVYLIYDHHNSKLSHQLTHLQHNHLLHTIVTTHVHLDHHHCLESIILKGKVKELEKLASHIASIKGVKLSKINLIADCSDLP
jgi:CopG family transcriptional regulator, nickel-responsive regulator